VFVTNESCSANEAGGLASRDPNVRSANKADGLALQVVEDQRPKVAGVLSFINQADEQALRSALQPQPPRSSTNEADGLAYGLSNWELRQRSRRTSISHTLRSAVSSIKPMNRRNHNGEAKRFRQ